MAPRDHWVPSGVGNEAVSVRPAGGMVGRRSHRLANRILRLAHSEATRVDFLRELCGILLNHTDSHVVELCVEEDGACARCSVAAGGDGHFQFRLAPCHRRTGEAPTRCERLLCEIARRSVDEWENGESSPCWQGSRSSRAEPIVRASSGDPTERPAVLLPLAMGDETIGWLLLESHGKRIWQDDDLAGLDSLAQSCSIALVNQRAQAALRERVKELTGLYRLAQLSERPGVSLEELLQGTADLLPPSWQYPEIAVGRIVVDGRCFASDEGADGEFRQRAPLVVAGEDRGIVEVVYLEERPILDEGPFLNEERNLLDTIARELAGAIERRQAAADRERLRHQLLHADRLATIGQLSAGVAHELNEPLGAVLGFAQLARKQEGLPPAAETDLEKIERAALHARDVVRKLMIFAHQTPPRTRTVNLNRVVEDSLAFLEARCAKADIEVVRNLESELPELVADLSQLQQVLVNLVVNAIQAMPDGGEIVISTVSRDGYVVLCVEDTGIGMSNEIRDKVFLPFFTTKDVGEGTGLGLAVVHGIVTAHGGAIVATSKMGLGSKFEVSLPILSVPHEELGHA